MIGATIIFISIKKKTDVDVNMQFFVQNKFNCIGGKHGIAVDSSHSSKTRVSDTLNCECESWWLPSSLCVGLRGVLAKLPSSQSIWDSECKIECRWVHRKWIPNFQKCPMVQCQQSNVIGEDGGGFRGLCYMDCSSVLFRLHGSAYLTSSSHLLERTEGRLRLQNNILWLMKEVFCKYRYRLLSECATQY